MDLDDSKNVYKNTESDLPESPIVSRSRSPNKGLKRTKSLRKTSRKKLPASKDFGDAIDGELFTPSQMQIIESIVEKKLSLTGGDRSMLQNISKNNSASNSVGIIKPVPTFHEHELKLYRTPLDNGVVDEITKDKEDD